MMYTELRWWVTDYAPFNKVLQYRVVEVGSEGVSMYGPWLNVPTVNMPKPYERGQR